MAPDLSVWGPIIEKVLGSPSALVIGCIAGAWFGVWINKKFSTYATKEHLKDTLSYHTATIDKRFGLLEETMTGNNQAVMNRIDSISKQDEERGGVLDKKMGVINTSVVSIGKSVARIEGKLGIQPE